MALWLLGPDPVGVCCDCEGKVSPCDNCAELGCEIECDSNGTANVTPCFPYPCYTFGAGTNCCTVNAEPGSCGPDLLHLIQTANVRLNLSGLTVGTDYRAQVSLNDGSGLAGYITWCFTATSSTETTSWQAIPAATLGGNQWSVIECGLCQQAAPCSTPCA